MIFGVGYCRTYLIDIPSDTLYIGLLCRRVFLWRWMGLAALLVDRACISYHTKSSNLKLVVSVSSPIIEAMRRIRGLCNFY
jgi:hypothetical protein